MNRSSGPLADRADPQPDQWIALVLGLGSVALTLVFVRPVEDAFALPKTITLLALCVVLVALLAVWFSSRRATSFRSSGALDAAVIYLVLVTAATVRSIDPPHSLLGEPFQYQGLLASGAYALGFAAAGIAFRDVGRVGLLARVVVATAALVAGYGLLQQLGLDPVWGALYKDRIFSTLGQANALAAYLVMALPLAIVVAVLTTGRAMVAVGAIATIGLGLVLTLSRGGYLGAITALGVLAACSWPVWRTRRLPVGVAIGVTVIVITVAAAVTPLMAVVERVVDRATLTFDLGEGSTESHLDLWAVGARISLEYPILGIGPEMYPEVFADFRDRVLSPSRAAVMAHFRPESPHNVLIAVADGAGLPALGVYLVLVVLCVARGVRSLSRSSTAQRLLVSALLAAVLGHLVTDAFMTAETAGSWLFWVLLGTLSVTSLEEPAAEAQ